MEIKSLNELKKIINLCRKSGIERFRTNSDGSFEFVLKEKPSTKRQLKDQKATEYVPSEASLSQEELLFWSSSGIPDVPKEA